MTLSAHWCPVLLDHYMNDRPAQEFQSVAFWRSGCLEVMWDDAVEVWEVELSVGTCSIRRLDGSDPHPLLVGLLVICEKPAPGVMVWRIIKSHIKELSWWEQMKVWKYTRKLIVQVDD